MHRSINAKLITLIAAIMAVTAVCVALIAAADLDKSLTALDERAGRNVLTLSKSLIEDEFNAHLDRRLDAVLDARKEMRNQTELVVAMVEAYRDLARKGQIPEERAKSLALDRISHSRHSLDQLYFVFDRSLNGLAHVDPAMVGRSWEGLATQSGNDSLKLARDLAAAKGDIHFLFFMNDDSGQPKEYIGYLEHYPAWDWFVGSAVDLGGIESQIAKEREAAETRLRDVFSRVSLGETGHVIVFNKQGYVFRPGATDRGPELAQNALTGNNLLDDFREAAQTPGSSLRYRETYPGAAEAGETRVAQFDFFKPWDWYLGVSLSEKELFAPKRLLISRQIAAMAAVSLLGLIVAFLVARRIIDPLRLLAKSAMKLPESDFSQTGPPARSIRALAEGRRDEVGALAKAMSSMLGEVGKSIAKLTEASKAKQVALDEARRSRDKLASLNADLERIVAGRTEELSKINIALTAEMRQREVLADTLRENQARLLEAQEIARLGNWEYRVADGETIFSDQLCHLLGFAPGAIKPGIGSLIELIAPHERERFLSLLKAGENSPKSFFTVSTQRIGDGEERLLQIRGARSELDGQTVLVGTIQDLTEEKKSQQALWRAELTVRALLDTPRDVMMILDTDGTILRANSVLADRLGRPAGSLIGQNIYDLMPSDVSKRRRAKAEQAVAGRSPVYFTDENQGIISDLAIYPVTETDGRAIQLIAHARNVTGQRALEKQLKENEALYRLLAENTMDIIALHDELGRIRYISPSVEPVIGFTPEELCDRPVMELMHPDDALDAAARLDAMIAGEGVAKVEYRIRRKDGHYLWLATSAKAIFSKQTGTFCGFTAASRDVSEQRRMDEELKASHENLERRVAERTVELRKLNRMLRKEAGERRLAEDNIRALSQQLLSAQESERRRISRDLHDDIAQNLTSLKLLSSRLQQRHKISGWDGESDLSDFSRILQDTIDSVRGLSFELLPSVLEQFGLVEAVSQLCHNFVLESAKQSGKAPHCDFTSKGVAGLGLDFETQINVYRLIQEGLSNIRKHAKSKSASVDLSATRNTLSIRIADDGVGFDAPAQLNQSLRNRRMGLWSMKSRVEIMQGVMELKTAPGKGSLVRIAIPVKGKFAAGRTPHRQPDKAAI
jgi:PAS domain S-box-containing protein